MQNDLTQIAFVMYCVEAYKSAKKLNGNKAYRILKEADAIRFIDNNYEALHTFGDAEIVWNIDEYMAHRKR